MIIAPTHESADSVLGPLFCLIQLCCIAGIAFSSLAWTHTQCHSLMFSIPLSSVYVCCCCSIEGQIGAGQFGSVSKGVWQLRGEGGEVMEGEVVQVAVKVVKKEAEEVQRVKLLQEAAIMGQFAHPNVVRLHGVVTVGDPVSGAPLLIIIIKGNVT